VHTEEGGAERESGIRKTKFVRGNSIGIWGCPLWGERPALTDELDALQNLGKEVGSVGCMRDDGTSLLLYGYGGQFQRSLSTRSGRMSN
jgi:hypothetical protein